MPAMNTLNSYEHCLLIAMPNLTDTWFEKTVVYVVEDNDFGSMGLVINLPHEFTIEQLLEHFELDIFTDDEALLHKHVSLGGPVEMEHGFILHSPRGNWEKSMRLKDDLAMTVSEDLLKDIASGNGPHNMLACLGFAGWEKGQLAEEIQNNNWISIPYNEALVFDTPTHNKWLVALDTLGIKPEYLSMEAGHG